MPEPDPASDQLNDQVDVAADNAKTDAPVKKKKAKKKKKKPRGEQPNQAKPRDSQREYEIVLRRDCPIGKKGDTIGTVVCAPGVTLNALVDAVRCDFATDK